MRRLVAASFRPLLTAAVISLAGCGMLTSDPQIRGNRVDLDALKELTPGTSTEADATSLLGSPTARASFNDNTWLYIGQVTQPRIAGTNSVTQQQVVALDFDNKGVLRDIKRLSKKDAKPVSVVSRETPSPGSQASLFQQLFGNVGSVSPGGLGGGGLGGSGGGTGAGGFPGGMGGRH